MFSLTHLERKILLVIALWIVAGLLGMAVL